MVGLERPRHRSPGDGLHHGRLDLDVAAGVHEATDLGDDRAAGDEHSADLGAGRQVEVTLPVAHLHVGDAVPLLGQGQEGLAEEGQLLRLDGELALASTHDRARNPHEIAEVDQIEHPVRGFPHRILADVDLEARLPVGQGRERSLALAALRHHASRDAHLLVQRLEGFQGLVAMSGHDLAQGVGPLVARRIDRDAHGRQGRRLGEAIRGLGRPARHRGLAGRGDGIWLVAHASRIPPDPGSPRTRRRIVSRTPFTKAGELASPNRLASSTASSRMTAGGVADSFISS